MDDRDVLRFELDRLLARLCDDVPTVEELARIEELVLSSDAFRARYLRYIELHGLAERRERGEVSLPIRVARPTVLQRSFVPCGIHEIGRYLRNSTLAPTLLVAVLVYGFFGLLVLQMSRDQLGRTRSSDLVDHGAIPTRSSTDAPVAHLVSVSNGRWHPRMKPLFTGSRLKPSTIELVHGLAELEFADGARVTIEGPCELELVSSKRGLIRSGKLLARVPQRAVGFCIATPTVEVVDLGTEFGVNVSKQGVVEIAVLTGKVEVNNLKTPAGARHQAENKKRIVSAGQAVTIRRSEAGQLTIDHAKFDDASAVSFSKQLKSTSRTPVTAVAYQVSENSAGNQSQFHGGVGLDFEVRVPIRVFSLGVFDHLGDGIDPATSPTVQLWSRDMKGTPQDTSDDVGHEMLASQVFSASDSGELKLGHRFKTLPEPIELPIGAYSIVAYGLSDANPFIKFEERHDVDFNNDHGWIGVNNTKGGNHFGWSSATNHAGGKAGEVGGTFARWQIDSFYGDTQLSQTFTLNDRVSASGKFNIRNISEGWIEKGKNGCFIGHFSKNSGNYEFIGLEFQEDRDTNHVRVRARLQVQSSTKTYKGGASSDWLSMAIDGNHSFACIYDPNLGDYGRLTVSIDTQPALVTDLDNFERNCGAQFDAFGMGSTPNLNSENDPTKSVDVYFDDVSYSGFQTKTSSEAFVSRSEELIARLRIERWHGAIEPRGSRTGECTPGTFPAGQVYGSANYVAGSFEYRPSRSSGKAAGNRE